jgi:hypothetical protein
MMRGRGLVVFVFFVFVFVFFVFVFVFVVGTPPVATGGLGSGTHVHSSRKMVTSVEEVGTPSRVFNAIGGLWGL